MYNIYILDPSEMRESWRLSEGFVAQEGKSLLPNLAKTRYWFSDTYDIFENIICGTVINLIHLPRPSGRAIRTAPIRPTLLGLANCQLARPVKEADLPPSHSLEAGVYSRGLAITINKAK